MVNFVTGAPSALLLFEILFLASFAAAAKIRVAIVTEPNYLQERVNNTMDFTVRCTVRESIYRYNRHSRASRVLARIRILVQTKVSKTTTILKIKKRDFQILLPVEVCKKLKSNLKCSLNFLSDISKTLRTLTKL